MLSVKQGGIKYHFLSLWYNLTKDWTQVSRTTGENHATGCINKLNQYLLMGISSISSTITRIIPQSVNSVCLQIIIIG